jgi:hypothetical protein
MHDYRVETEIGSDGSLTIKGLPFQAGDRVEVIIRDQKAAGGNGKSYPLRGKRIRYADPFGGVAQEDWEVLK